MSIIKDSVEVTGELLEGAMTPSSTKGAQEDNDVYRFYGAKEFAIEEARRKSDAKENVNFIYALVFQAQPEAPSGLMVKVKGLCKTIEFDEDEERKRLDRERVTILKAIEEAGFVTESVFDSTKKNIIVKIGCNDDRLLREAELREHKLELNPKSLQHVLELRTKEADPDADIDKPKHAIYMGFADYTEEEYVKVLQQGGEDTLPIYRNRDFLTGNLTNKPVSLSTAKRTFLNQCKADPFKHIHFKYDYDWEKKIIEEHKVQLYRTYTDGTILRNVDRIDLLSVALARDATPRRGIKGAGLNLKNLLFDKKVRAAFPIEYNSQIRKARDMSSSDIYEKFKTRTCCGCNMFLPFKQPVQDIRDYCGEKVAYYFAFLEFYSFFLIFSAIAGLIVFAIQMIVLNEEKGTPDLLNPIDVVGPVPLNGETDPDAIRDLVQAENEFVSGLTPIALSFNQNFALAIITPTEIPVLVPIFAILIAFWSTAFIEFWKRRESTLAFKWGVSDFEKKAELRPEFKSQFDIPDAVTGLPTPYRSKYSFFGRLTVSFSSVATLVGVTVAAFAATYVFKAAMSQSDSLDPAIAVQVALVLNAVAIIILATFFKKLGKKLTDFENHRTDIEYEDQLILKIFIFSFFNSYTTLLYFAFIKSGITLLGQNQFCSVDLEDFEADNDVVDENVSDIEIFENLDLGEDRFRLFLEDELFFIDSCYGALGYSLVIIFVSQIVVNNAQEIGIPLAKFLMKSFFSGKALKKATSPLNLDVKQLVGGEEKAEDPTMHSTNITKNDLPLKAPAEKQYLLQPYETPFYDYLELALQFGYVTLFVAAFPLAPLLALINNFVEVIVDSNKVFVLSRRPNVARAQDIGSWLKIFEVLSYFAVIINGAVLVFTSVEIIPVDPDKEENRVWAFIVFVVGVFTIKYILDIFLKDTPEDIVVMLERQQYFEQKIFFDTEDDNEKFVVKVGDVEKEVKDDDEDEDVITDEEIMELLTRFEPLQQDPYMNDIIQEVKEKMRNTGLTKEKIFNMIDTNNTESISLKELKNALAREDIGIGAEVEKEVIQLFVNALDIDGDGKISRKELTVFLESDSVPEEEV